MCKKINVTTTYFFDYFTISVQYLTTVCTLYLPPSKSNGLPSLFSPPSLLALTPFEPVCRAVRLPLLRFVLAWLTSVSTLDTKLYASVDYSPCLAALFFFRREYRPTKKLTALNFVNEKNSCYKMLIQTYRVCIVSSSFTHLAGGDH
jgi:hypothetical protein